MKPREILKEIPRWDITDGFTANGKIDKALLNLRKWVLSKKKKDRTVYPKSGYWYNQAIEDIAKELI